MRGTPGMKIGSICGYLDQQHHMRPFLIFFLLFARPDSAHATSIEFYKKAKDGITLFAIITMGSEEERKVQDAFLDKLVRKLKRRDKSIPIYILADQFDLWLFRNRTEWFGAIAYDTLRDPDHSFI